MAKILASGLDKTIELPNRYTNKTVQKAVQDWFRKNRLLDESSYVETQQGLKIFFTGISEWHFPADVMNSYQKDIALQIIPYLPEVFEKGVYRKIQPLTKDRSQSRAKFIQFHIFEKQVTIGKFSVKVRVKAGEYPNGKIVMLPKLSAYTFTVNKIKKSTDLLDDRAISEETTAGHMQIKSASFQSADMVNDSAFDDEDQVGFEILDIERIKSPQELAIERAFQCWTVR